MEHTPAQREQAGTEACPAVLTGAFKIGDRDDWPCELDGDGHEWHERDTPPLKAKWRQRGATTEVAWALVR
jgi:hypothetical protein